MPTQDEFNSLKREADQLRQALTKQRERADVEYRRAEAAEEAARRAWKIALTPPTRSASDNGGS